MKGRFRKGGEGAQTHIFPTSLPRIQVSPQRVWAASLLPPWGSLCDACPALREDTRLPPQHRPLRSHQALTSHLWHLQPGRGGGGGRQHRCPARAAVLVQGLENLPSTFSSDVPPSRRLFQWHSDQPLTARCSLALYLLLPVFGSMCSCVFTSYLQGYELLGGRN